MSEIFTTDNMVIRILNRIGDILILHFLWLLCSLPIVTIGASTTALYYTAMKAVKYEDGYVARRFFKSFKENFRQSTIIWLIMLFAGFLCGWYLSYSIETHNSVLTMFSTILTCVYTFILIYVFPLQSKFDNKITVTIRNAFLLSVKNFPWTLLMIVALGLIGLFSYFYTIVLFIVVICGAGVYGYLTAFIFNRVFLPYLPDEPGFEKLKFNTTASDAGEEAEDGNIDEDTDEAANEDVQDNAAVDTSDQETVKTNTTAKPKDTSEKNKTAAKVASGRKLSLSERANSVASYTKQEDNTED